MNTTKTLVAALIVAAGAAFTATGAQAADADPGYPQAYTPTVTRADVLQQTRAAAAQGLLRHGELPVVATAFEPIKTRHQVHAETIEALHLGLVDNGEASTVYTAEQLQRIQNAGLRARGTSVAAR